MQVPQNREMTGGCQCGAIRYEITSFPLLLYTCNCTDCQRQTGSAFALNMPVRFRDFRILPAANRLTIDAPRQPAMRLSPGAFLSKLLGTSM